MFHNNRAELSLRLYLARRLRVQQINLSDVVRLEPIGDMLNSTDPEEQRLFYIRLASEFNLCTIGHESPHLQRLAGIWSSVKGRLQIRPSGMFMCTPSARICSTRRLRVA